MSWPDLPGKIDRARFIRALIRLGFILEKSGGRGSHYKLIWPKSQKFITVQAEIRKDVLRYILKEIESISGLTWVEIKKEL